MAEQVLGKYRPQFPVVPARRNEYGEYVPAPLSETHVIINGLVRLKEVPQYTGSPDDIVIENFVPTQSLNPGPGEYKVNFFTGRIYFHESDNGKTVTINYKGLGSLVAVDEINYLWYLFSNKEAFFTALMDTPDSYESSAFKYVRVNKSATGLEFTAPSVGRSVNKYIPLFIQANQTMNVESEAIFDLVKIYEINFPEPITENYGFLNFSAEDDTKLSQTPEGWWTLNLANVSAGEAYFVECMDDGLDTSTWNSISKIIINEEKPEETEIKYLIKADDEYYGFIDGNFVKLKAFTGHSIQINGVTSEILQTLDASRLNAFVGKKISLVASLTTSDVSVTPVFKNFITIEGTYNSYYKETGKVKATLYPEVEVIKLENTVAEDLHIVVVLGAGRDEICCTADEFVYEDLDPGQPVTIKAPTQTIAQVEAKFDSQTISTGIAIPNTSNQWHFSPEDYEVLFYDYSDIIVGELTEAKAVESLGYDFQGILKFNNFDTSDALNKINISTKDVGKCITPLGCGITVFENNTIHSYIKADDNVSSMFCLFSFDFPPSLDFIIFARNDATDRNSSRRYVMIKRTDTGFGYYFDTHSSLAFGGPLYKQFGNFYAVYSDGSYLHTFDENGNFIHQANSTSYYSYGPLHVGSLYPSTWYTNSYRPIYCALIVYGLTSEEAENVLAYVKNKYNEFKSYFGIIDKQSHFYMSPKVSVDSINSISLVDLNISLPIFYEFDGTISISNTIYNRYLLELDGILYKWDGSNLVEVDSSLPDNELYNLANTISDIQSIPQSAWDSISFSKFGMVVIPSTEDFKFAPYLHKKYLINNQTVTADGWRVLQANDECVVQWLPDRKVWKIQHLLPQPTTIKVKIAGSSDTQLNPLSFTELVDTPNSLSYSYPQTLVANNGSVRLIPWINPFMLLRP